MKLLYVAGRFPKRSETFVFNEVAGHLDRGHDVRVLTLEPGEPMGLPEERDILERVHRVPRFPLAPGARPPRAGLAAREGSAKRRLYAALAARWAGHHVAQGWTPDVVHAHFLTLPALVGSGIGDLLRVPWSFMAHSQDYRLELPPEQLRARVLHASAGFVPSQFALAELAARAQLGPGDCAHLGVMRAVTRARVRPRRTRPDGPPTLISVARLLPVKGLDVAIRAVARVRERRPAVRYRIAGDGPERPALERLAQDLGVGEAVTFLGSVTNERAQALLAEAHVAVLPCRPDPEGRMDGLPVSLIEAGLTGVPVVSTEISGIPELVEHERGGLLVPPGDDAALARALERIVADPAFGERCAAELRVRIEAEFAAERQFDRLYESWSQLALPQGAGSLVERYAAPALTSSSSIAPNARSPL